MAVYEPIVIGIPPWLYERVEYMGLSGAATMLRSQAAAASEDGDDISADAYTMWVSVIERASQYPGRASARSSFMTLRKA